MAVTLIVYTDTEEVRISPAAAEALEVIARAPLARLGTWTSIAGSDAVVSHRAVEELAARRLVKIADAAAWHRLVITEAGRRVLAELAADTL